jgi:formylglycine-generating enzyme required for sulfatase activity
MKKASLLLLAIMLLVSLVGTAAAQAPAKDKKARKAKKATAAATAEVAGDARVANVKAKQAGNRVVFEYDLEGAVGAAEVVVTLTVQGRTYEARDLHLSGDLGKVGPGRGKRITWNVLQDFPKGYGGAVDWEIKAAGEGRPKPVTTAAAVPVPAAVSGSQVFTSRYVGRFVLIPAGTFTMGSPASETGRYDNETQHRVTISRAFYLQTTEVTQGQWQAVMGSNPSHFSSCGSDCPVEKVSWNDVQEFIGKLNRMEGTDKYRLPTEAEWEYAARAGSTTALYNGPLTILGDNNGPELDAIAWYGGNSCVSYSGGYDCSGWKNKQYSCTSCGTHPVGRKQPNAWGLYDMLGNVWEWCQDWYGGYPSGSVSDPEGPSSGSGRVLRGGSWRPYARLARAANRSYFAPGYRDCILGFRLLRTL